MIYINLINTKEIINMEGFGIKSYNKLIKAIDKSRKVKLSNFIYALGISRLAKMEQNSCKRVW